MTDVSGRGPRMSVVIPNYNHGHLIEDALVAISRQTMLPSEVVVVDDGSTDDSVTRLQSLAAGMVAAASPPSREPWRQRRVQ
jgi:GT2 family glycosyltransferase